MKFLHVKHIFISLLHYFYYTDIITHTLNIILIWIKAKVNTINYHCID